MKIIYNNNFSLIKLPTKVTLAASESKTFSHNYAATGFALIGCTGSVTVEASNDDFASTIHSSVQTGNVTVDLAGTVDAEKWRVTANAGGATIQYIYVGELKNIDEPSHPYLFEKRVLATDRQTRSGRRYSKVHGTPRAGLWIFKNVAVSNAPDWRSWFDATDGFRKAFIVHEPLIDEAVIITAAASVFPMIRQNPSLMTGRMSVQELL